MAVCSTSSVILHNINSLFRLCFIDDWEIHIKLLLGAFRDGKTAYKGAHRFETKDGKVFAGAFENMMTFAKNGALESFSMSLMTIPQQEFK